MSIAGNGPPLERPEFVTPPVIEPLPQRSIWTRLLERKFIVAVVLSLSGIVALVTGTAPFSLAVLTWILAPVLVWVGLEAMLDFRRTAIPDKPGPWDDLVRAGLGFAESYFSQDAVLAADKAELDEDRAKERHRKELELLQAQIDRLKQTGDGHA